MRTPRSQSIDPILSGGPPRSVEDCVVELFGLLISLRVVHGGEDILDPRIWAQVHEELGRYDRRQNLTMAVFSQHPHTYRECKSYAYSTFREIFTENEICARVAME